MHQARPYGLHIIGNALTSNDQAFISTTAKRFANFKDVSELASLRQVYDLPDGGYIVIQDMGGNFRVIAHKPEGIEPSVRDGMASDYIPMLYSGVVMNTAPISTDGVPINLTEVTRRRLVGYDPNISKPEKIISLQRFLIEYDLKFTYFKPANTGARTFTQYQKLRSTWYSGAMSEVVQIVGGYGRQDFEELPDEEIERKRMIVPKKIQDRIRQHVAGQRLPAYDGVPDFEGKYKYDYHHRLCNAVSFDTAGKPWLLRISPAGVYAMPLPIIPATTAPEFLDYLYEVDDHELIHVVERFGGLPSGENFLTGDDFQAWYRAGAIIKVCDTSEFYKYNDMYTACGWAFNSQGTEGFNTCWSGNGDTMRYAHGFKMRLRLGSARNNGWVSDSKNLTNEEVTILGRFMARINIALNGNGHRERAIRYKIINTPASKLLSIATLAQVDINYWENLIADPIAIHSGNISEVSRGSFYWHSKNPLSFGQLKFPEFTGNGCQSFDMSMPEYKGPAVNCDTVVFGCYINDQLTVIKYFYDLRLFKSKIDLESTFEEIMIIGEWEKTTTGKTSGLLGHLYTTVFDDRREVSDNTIYTKVIGKDLGYGNPAFSTPPLLFTTGSLSRARYYSQLTQETIINGSTMDVAVCVPNACRDQILYAHKEGSDSKSYSEKLERLSVADPTSYSIWTYDPLFHWIGGTGRGEPIPTIGEFAYANYDPAINYKPTPYSWFSESGNWYNVPEDSFIDVSGIVARYTIRSSNINGDGVLIGGEAPQLNTYAFSNTTFGQKAGKVGISIQVKGVAIIHKRLPDEFYFDFSPVFVGGEPIYFNRDATWIAAGKQQYSNNSEIKDYERNLRTYFGNTSLVDHKSAHCFIGVINE